MHARLRDDHWVLERSWAAASLRLPEAPELTLRIGDDEALVHLAEPIALPPGARVATWIAWPMVLEVRAGRHTVDQRRPGMRQSLMGALDAGRVLPAARCATLLHPLAELPPAHAALQVSLANQTSGLVPLRRFPISEPSLHLARHGERVAGGHIQVTVTEPMHAEVLIRSWTPPAGFEPVSRDGQARRDSVFRLDWLLDSTRRSTEFPL